MHQPAPIQTAKLRRHLECLTETIGVRLAGSAGEQKAAAYLAAEFRRSGAAVSVETFPMQERWVRSQRLAIRLGSRWREFPCSLISSTPGTGGKTLAAPLVFFEAPAEDRRRNLDHLRDKAVVHLGTHIESRAAYRRLIQARPKFLLFVDVRYPGAVPLADGLFPAYTRDLGAVPTVNVAFQDAWRWKAEGAGAARLNVVGGMRPASSQNVVAELPGADASAGALFLGAHHDTQADSVGADDNAAGSCALLELARVLAPLPRRRAIRLISFGTEEQLSVGSAEYVRRHRAELARSGKLMFNLDAFGSRMGWTILVGNGPKSLAQTVLPYFEKQGYYLKASVEVMPYCDHFPFVAAGVPGLWLGRNNCTAGRFFHHRPDDDLSRLSLPLMAGLLNATARMIADFAAAKRLPFPAVIPAEQRPQIRRFWRDLYGGF
jgi:aminopeptidase YwaD